MLSDILATSCTAEEQTQLLHSLKGLYWVSVCWILNNALCFISGIFSGFYCVPHCAINIWHHMLCYLPNINNYITFTASLERVQFEIVQSFPVVQVLYFSDFAFHGFQNWQQYSSRGITRDFKSVSMRDRSRN